MALSPALTCWMAWLPVRAPRAATYSSEWSRSQRRAAPRSASGYRISTEPERRTTSCAEYVRSIPLQRASELQLAAMSAALRVTMASSLFLPRELFVGGDRQKVRQSGCGRERVEEGRRALVAPGAPAGL